MMNGRIIYTHVVGSGGKKLMGTSRSSYPQVIKHSAGHSTIYRGCSIPMFD